MENKQIKKATLCWRCRHAVPSASTGCSWSRRFVPVEGWTAEKHQQKQSGSVYETYCVISCPLCSRRTAGTVLTAARTTPAASASQSISCEGR